jgi:hypothetical protein
VHVRTGDHTQAMAVPITVFLFIEQTITGLLLQQPASKLRKGSYFHGTTLLAALLNGAAPLLGEQSDRPPPSDQMISPVRRRAETRPGILGCSSTAELCWLARLPCIVLIDDSHTSSYFVLKTRHSCDWPAGCVQGCPSSRTTSHRASARRCG